MIFVASTEERSLSAFDTMEGAISNHEGLDVEAGEYLFWNALGEPLEPEFLAPNKRGMFSVQNGTYTLVPASGAHHAHLSEALSGLQHFASPAPFDSAESVRAYIARGI